MRKFTIIILALIMVISLVSCASSNTDGESDADASSSRGTTENVPQKTESRITKIALLLNSTIDDEGWSQTSYAGYMLAVKEFGFEPAYTENISIADMESVIRNYATRNYEVLVLSGADFTDVAVNMAAEYPDIYFLLINGNAAQEPNLANYRPMTIECGFVAGAFSALVSKNNAVGIVNGQKFPPVEDAGKGFIAGAKFIDSDVDVRVTYTDSWTDIQKAYEAALGMIEAGVDVLASNCSDGVVGVIQAAQENGALVTGYIGDQHEMAPETIPFSAIQDVGMLIYAGIKDVINGDFRPEVVPGGVKEGVIRLSKFYSIDGAEIASDIQLRMQEIIDRIADGSLKEMGVLPKSVFE